MILRTLSRMKQLRRGSACTAVIHAAPRQNISEAPYRGSDNSSLDNVVDARDFSMWGLVRIGTHKTIAELHRALRVSHVRIGASVDRMLDRITLATEVIELELVNVSVAQLGFKDGATTQDIFARAVKMGLELCPSEVGPQLRLQYRDQQTDSMLTVGMKAMANPSCGLCVFDVRRYNRYRWLVLDDAYPGRVWHEDSRWVFVRSKLTLSDFSIHSC